MKASFDYVKIVGYTIAILSTLTAGALSPLLAPFGFSDAKIAAIAAFIGGLAAFLTNLSNVFKNPSPPDGTHAVLSTSTTPVPQTLTTRSDPGLAAKVSGSQ